MKKNNIKTKVAIYVRFEDDNFDEMKRKEEALINYCNNNNYEIVEKYYDNYERSKEDYTKVVRSLLFKNNLDKFEKLIAEDIFDLCRTKEQILNLRKVIKNKKLKLETIKQGLFDEMTLNRYKKNCLFELPLNENYESVAIYFRLPHFSEEKYINNEYINDPKIMYPYIRELITDYCIKNKYKVVKVYYDFSKEYYKELINVYDGFITDGFSDMLRDSFNAEYEKIVLYSLDELSDEFGEFDQVASCFNIFKRNNIDIETIKEGLYNVDYYLETKVEVI